MATLPPEAAGEVRLTLRIPNGDGTDTGAQGWAWLYPNLRPGTVYRASNVDPLVAVKTRLEFKSTGTGELLDPETGLWAEVLASDAPGATFPDMQWVLDLHLDGVNPVEQPRPLYFTVPAQSFVNVGLLVDTTNQLSVVTVVSEQTKQDAEAARDLAEQYRDETLAHRDYLSAPADEQVAGYVNGTGPTNTALSATYLTQRQVQRYSSMRAARPGDAFPAPMFEEPRAQFSSTVSTFSTRKIWPLALTNGPARWWGFPALGVVGTVTGPDGATYNTYGDVRVGGGIASPSYWEFLTDAPIFDVFGSLHSGSPIWVEIDGRAFRGGAFSPDNSYFRFEFPTRKLRAVRIYSNEGFKPAAIITNVTDSVMPTAATRPRLGMMTDSYGQGGVFAALRPHTIPYLTGELLGVDVIKSSIGGTGYAADNGANSDFLARTPQYDGVSISAMLWLGGINDAATGLQEAATACFERFASAHPDTPQIALGPWSPSTTWQTTNAAKWDAIEAAIEAVGGVFIDNRDWVVGTGKLGAPAGDGNADVIISSDGTHPSSPDVANGIGTTILAQRLATAVQNRIADGSIR